MKKPICLILTFLFLMAQSAYAHPPGNIKAIFDSSSRTLKVNISHIVTNPKSHYIREAYITLNGDKAIEQIIKLQETDSSQFLQYSIPDAEEGDTMRIEARCSSFGKKFKEIKVK